MQTTEILRTEVKFRFIDYLKAAQIPYYEPSLTVCPHCGQHAQVVGDFLWSCPNCGSKGDVVDYAMESHGFRKSADALKHVCWVLGVKICSLDTIAAEELMDMQFPDNPELIEGLLGKGLYLLAGASKIGKSWLVLWLAHCVSLGLPVWELKTRQCGVLYLSLEDTDQRLQRRLVEVTGGETGDLTILLVHHTRKQEADDAVDKISGTTGLIGCADGSLILEKENRLGTQGSLTVTSREHPDKKLLLDFDREKKIWKFLGYADSQEEELEDPILAAVGSFLRDKPSWKGTATELLEALLQINSSILAKPNSLVRKLNAKTRELSERYGIRYTGRREENVKYLILERVSDTSDTCDISGTPPGA